MHSSDSPDWPEGVRQQLQLSRQFAAGLIPGLEFETAFLRARGEAKGSAPPHVRDVVRRIFYGVDEYVVNDDIREPEKGDLDEEQLREIVRTQLRRLDEA